MFKIEDNYFNFEKKIFNLFEALNSQNPNLINTNLQIENKKQWNLCLLKLTEPFFRLFNCDPFSHVRINSVAKSLQVYCDINKQFLMRNLKIIEDLHHKFIHPLNKKLKGKYRRALDNLSKSLYKYIPNPIEPKFVNCLIKKPTFFQMNWPSDMENIQIEKKEQEVVNNIFNSVFEIIQNQNNYELETLFKGNERKLNIYRKRTLILSFDIPLEILLLQEKLPEIAVVTRKNCNGFTRKLNVVYNLTTGEYLLKKKCEFLEIEIIDYLKSYARLKKIKGLPFPHYRIQKDIFLEPLYEGSLNIILGTKALENWKTKFSLIEDIISGIFILHGIRFEPFPTSFPVPSGELEKNFKFCHLELNPSNILVRRSPTGEWNAAISGFSSACTLTSFATNFGYDSPESCQYRVQLASLKNKDSSEIIKYNIETGEARDIWALGLIILTILVGNCSKKFLLYPDFPPLPSLERLLIESNREVTQDSFIANLTQENISKDINELKTENDDHLGKKWNSLLDLVENMLKVSPKERIKLSGVMKILQTIEKNT